MRRIRLRRGMRCYGARPMPAARSTTTPELSVVVPVCDEEASLPVLLARLDDVLGTLGVAHELVLVDDGSRDGTAGILRERFAAHPEVTRVVTLRGNHGQHAAVLAGLEHARGRRVVTLDADLQNPPEEIPKLLAGLDAGHDYVGGVRRVRRDGPLRRLVSRLSGRLLAATSRVRLGDPGCMLRAFDRGLVDAVNGSPEVHTFVPALAWTLARNPTEVEVEHAPRAGGRSRYPLWRLLGLELDLATAFSLLPIRWITTSGLALGGAGAVLVLLELVLWPWGVTLRPGGVPGLALLLVGWVLLALGVVGEYVGRMHERVLGRPRFQVAELLGVDAPRRARASAAKGASSRPRAASKPRAPRKPARASGSGEAPPAEAGDPPAPAGGDETSGEGGRA